MNRKVSLCVVAVLTVCGIARDVCGCFVDPIAHAYLLESRNPWTDLLQERWVYVIRINRWFTMYGATSEDPDGGTLGYPIILPIRTWDWFTGTGLVWEDWITGHTNSALDPEDMVADGICRYYYEYPGYYQVQLCVTDTDSNDSGGAVPDHTDCDPESMPYQVMAFDLDIDISSYVGVNDDDDDEDGILDYDDGYNKDGISGNADDGNSDEDDLVAISLSFSPSNCGTGRTELYVHPDSWDHVKIWKDPKKGAANLLLPISGESGPDKWKAYWRPPNTMPSTLWLEVESMPNDSIVDLMLTYQVAPTPSGYVDVPDGWAADWSRVVQMHLTAEDLFYSAVPNPSEETSGAYVHFNLDNDNDSYNNVPSSKHPGADYYDDANPVSGEDDLKSVLLAMSPLLEDGVVVLENNSSGELWSSNGKGSTNHILGPYDSLSWDLSNQQERNQLVSFCNYYKYMEGATTTDQGEITFEYYSPFCSLVHRDRIKYTFIAADCGDQPTTDNGQRGRFETAFPSPGQGGLVRCEWSITDNRLTDTYNCIAWSVDEDTVWYNPWDIDQDPSWGDDDGIFEDTDMDGFYMAKKRWTLITSGTNEQRAAQAEAMYYSYGQDWDYVNYPNSPPSTGYHGARRKTCSCGAGKWIMYESKCGGWEQIEHVWNQLNNSSYGDPDRFYR